VLEVGCGRGEFLALLDALPARASGLEFAPASIEACRAQGLKVTEGYPDAATGLLPDAPFDAFMLLMFLEHMPDPNASLQAIHDNLAEGAVGLVEVPNFEMMIRRNLFSEFISDHLFYFTRQTLGTTLNLNGFDILASEEIRDEYVLSVVVRKRPTLDLGSFRANQNRLAAAIHGYLDQFGKERVAVWGASHQALAILALTGTAHRFRYVVDSAPFKQGHYTPATHRPIVAPETLRNDPVDAVLVMAASYSDEVAGILRRQYDPGLSVAILRENGLQYR
jgi:SAM-dependent methyltransferase